MDRGLPGIISFLIDSGSLASSVGRETAAWALSAAEGPVLHVWHDSTHPRSPEDVRDQMRSILRTLEKTFAAEGPRLVPEVAAVMFPSPSRPGYRMLIVAVPWLENDIVVLLSPRWEPVDIGMTPGPTLVKHSLNAMRSRSSTLLS
jgi:hypothetical protein